MIELTEEQEELIKQLVHAFRTGDEAKGAEALKSLIEEQVR